MSRLFAAIRNLFGGRRVDRDTDAELRAFLEHAADAHERSGLSRSEAERAARLELGGLAQVSEDVRDARAGRRLESLWRDLSYGARVLRRSPGFTVAVTGVLVIGIAASTAIFSLVNGVLLRPAPVAGADDLIRMFHTPPQASFPGVARFSVSPANFLDWRARNHSFTDLAIYGFSGAILTGTSSLPEAVNLARVSSNVFAMTSVVPAMGRLFNASDEEPGHGHIALVSMSFWKDHFGGVPLNGQSLTLDDERFPIVGVLPATFEWPAWTITASSIWTPIAWTDADRAVRDNHNYSVIGRLRPGVSLEAAAADMNAISVDLAREHPVENTGWGAVLVPLQDLIVGPVRQSLLILLAAVGFLLLIASANASNLILGRALAKRREMAIRAALGATRVRIIRQIVVETLLLSVVAAGAGIAVAELALSAFATFLTDQLPRAGEVALDGRVVAFTVGVAMIAGLLASVGPAIRATRSGIQDTLKQGWGRTDSAGAGRLGRRVLVGIEVALSLVLLVGAGLMARSVWSLLHVDAGFDSTHLLTLSVGLPQSKYPTPAARSAFFDDVLTRMRALPGVSDAAFIDSLPLAGGSVQPFTIVGRPAPVAADALEIAVRLASPGYLRTMRISVLKGRDVDPRDPHAVLISQAAAKAFWPGADPVGQRVQFKFRPDETFDVVGVVADVKLSSLDSDALVPTVYQFARERPWSYLVFVVRTAGPPSALAAAAAGVIHDRDPNQAVRQVQTMDDRVAAATASRRFEMDLLGTFAGLALALTAIGMFSVLAHAVRGRSREIAVRSALGASMGQVVRMVFVEGLVPTAGGLAAGLLVALWLGPTLKTLVFGVGAFDPATYVVVSMALLVVSGLAGLVPAWRAAHLDPLTVLRED